MGPNPRAAIRRPSAALVIAFGNGTPRITGSSTYVPVVTKSLPAGHFVATGTVQIAVTNTTPGGSVGVRCELVDGHAKSITVWASAVNAQVPPGQYFTFANVPLSLAFGSQTASTLTLQCELYSLYAAGGTMNVYSDTSRIEAIQTEKNS